jgi:hypothetical protein
MGEAAGLKGGTPRVPAAVSPRLAISDGATLQSAAAKLM